MRRLQEKEYENYDNGGPIRLKPEEIDCLAPYEHTGDGLLAWECGRCGAEHSTRMFKSAGVVLRCGREVPVFPSSLSRGEREEVEHKLGVRYRGGCGARNLLVHTNCTEINGMLKERRRQDEAMRENERLRGIMKYNEEVLAKIVRFLKMDMDRALGDSLYRLKASIETEMQRAAAEAEKAA